MQPQPQQLHYMPSIKGNLSIPLQAMSPNQAYQGCCPMRACGTPACPIERSRQLLKPKQNPHSPHEKPVEDSSPPKNIENEASYITEISSVRRQAPKEEQAPSAPSSYHQLERLATQEGSYNNRTAPASPSQGKGLTAYEVLMVNGKMVAREVTPPEGTAAQSYRAEQNRETTQPAGKPYHAPESSGTSGVRAGTQSIQAGKYAAQASHSLSPLKQQDMRTHAKAHTGNSGYVANAPRTSVMNGAGNYVHGHLPPVVLARDMGVFNPKQPTLEAAVASMQPKQEMLLVPAHHSYAPRHDRSIAATVTVHAQQSYVEGFSINSSARTAPAKQEKAITSSPRVSVARQDANLVARTETVAKKETQTHGTYAGNSAGVSSAVIRQASPSPFPREAQRIEKNERLASASLTSLITTNYDSRPTERKRAELAKKQEVSTALPSASYRAIQQESGQKMQVRETAVSVKTSTSQRENPVPYRENFVSYRPIQQATERNVSSIWQRPNNIFHAGLDYLLGAYSRSRTQAQHAPKRNDAKEPTEYDSHAVIHPNYENNPVIFPPQKTTQRKDMAGEDSKKEKRQPEKIDLLKNAEKPWGVTMKKIIKKHVPAKPQKRTAPIHKRQASSIRTRLQGMDARMSAIAVALGS